ncbi:MAG: DUF5067 domain-containing protein [Oscillospiraceae bacterium]|nr:DUF5067 domain-containing protein [Oscillospiraceae bacterium]
MKRFTAFLLAALLLLSLAACGGKDKNAGADDGKKSEVNEQKPVEQEKPAEPEKESAAGYYKMSGVVENGETSDLSQLEALGLIFYLVLNEDGTGFMEMMGEREEITWTETGITNSTGEKAAYQYKDGVLTVESDGSSITYIRLSDEELAYYNEHGSSFLSEGETHDTEGELDGCYVSFVGAEAVKNEDGEDAIRIWYDFTNKTDKVVTPFWTVSLNAEQDGEDLDYTYLYEDVPESGNSALSVAPGYTARCAELYRFNPEGGTIKASISAYFNDKVVCEFDPAALPGAPEYDGPAWEADPSMPAYMEGVPESGAGLELLGYETDFDWSGENVVIVRFRFTNTTDESNSFFSVFNACALQDGFGLPTSMCDAYSEEQGNVTEEIAPGASVECACVYLPRSDDPFAVVFKNMYTDEYFGKAFELSFG